MTPTLTTELQQIAEQAAIHIARLNGENDTFEVEGATIIAEIRYEAEIGEDAGDYWTAPSWWIESERISVEALYDEAGNHNPEAAAYLEKYLN